MCQSNLKSKMPRTGKAFNAPFRACENFGKMAKADHFRFWRQIVDLNPVSLMSENDSLYFPSRDT